ncbi:DUF2161 domain-containing phosphodiesterase [Sporosarcina psychrophila]|uniref:DUF2161 domain-containing phosphodiesterase n=1 Tax=Sporosarcina psychrophila TaxID=1476 RepID=UPI00078B8FEF|nr:DUF2161 family putative PD-(D/E)XK-type phosphodiesterase [Sporosarcina psychrophila]AMQ06329.1 hypothetical protein AZE41_10565 [Sporosarcina psychrophila]
MQGKETKRYEVDLYKPVKEYFTQQGYDVHGEVNECDVAAVRDQELVLIELKLSLSIDLLIQATKRQRLTNEVYVAIPRPKLNFRSKKWKDSCHLVRRLELGLILVSFLENDAQVEIVFHPASFDRKKSMQRSKKKRNAMLTEMEGRLGDYNIGGSCQTKIMTAYKENCIHIACCLLELGPLSPKSLRKMGTGEKTLTILNKNYYGWFDKIQRGIYMISDIGKNELHEFPDLISYYHEVVRETASAYLDIDDVEGNM